MTNQTAGGHNKQPLSPQAQQAPLHIVHYVWGFHTGGLENGVVNLINHLPAGSYRHSIICQKGYDPHFFARIQAPNVAIYDIAKKEGTDLALFWRLAKLLWQLKADIFHSRNLSTMEGQLVAALLRVPLRVHGEHGWDVGDLGGSNLKYQKLRRLLKGFVHQFVALSSEAELYLQQKIAVASQKIRRICNGVDLQRFAAQTDATTTANAALPWQFESSDFVFGTVGRMATVKNQQLLLNAFIELCRRYPEQASSLRLLLVGDGALRQTLEQQALAAKLQQAVVFAGNSSNVPLMLSQMDVFVLPSLAEGISNTLLEAMAAGLPVIASRVGGNPELIVPEHQHSHLFESNNVGELADCMALYIKNPERYQTDSQLVKKHCQNNFSLDTMVQRYHQLYQSVRNKDLI